jgi:uncharacterized protein YciI
LAHHGVPSTAKAKRGRPIVPYVIITEDKPNSLALRNEVRAVHIDYLTANQHRLLAAGAQIDDDGTGGSGGVIIVDTDDRKEAEDFIANDPFTKAGLFTDIKVTRWRKAFFNFERLV